MNAKKRESIGFQENLSEGMRNCCSTNSDSGPGGNRMSSIRKLVFTLILAFLAFVGTLSVTPGPAHAIVCPSSFLGCPYSHQEPNGTSGGIPTVCCWYRCDGTMLRGACRIA
jgi:hypothetical protein